MSDFYDPFLLSLSAATIRGPANLRLGVWKCFPDLEANSGQLTVNRCVQGLIKLLTVLEDAGKSQLRLCLDECVGVFFLTKL